MSSASSSSSLIDLTAAESPADSYQGKNFVFTINNPGDVCKPLEEFGRKLDAALIGGRTTASALKFAIWSHEVADSGTPHIQGYLQLEKKTKIQALRNKLTKFKAWVARANGTGQQSVEYVSHTGKHADKPGLLGGPWSYGELDETVQGQRTDINALGDAILAGASMKQLCTDHTSTMLKYFGNAQKIKQVVSVTKRAWRTELHILTGRAGSGKSYTAHEEGRKYLRDNNLNEEIYDLPVPAPGQRLWFQGYEGQSVVCIDDFYGTIDIHMIKRMADELPLVVEVKNTHEQFLARQIYITSNIGWRNWWPKELLANKNDAEAIQRRITSERTFTETYEERVNAARQVTMLNDEPIPHDDIGEVGDLACEEDYDAIRSSFDARPLSPADLAPEEYAGNQEIWRQLPADNYWD